MGRVRSGRAARGGPLDRPCGVCLVRHNIGNCLAPALMPDTPDNATETFMPPSSLDGRRILVVEDEAMIAMLLEVHLADFGCEVAGSANSVRAALQLIEDEPGADAAILDMNLAGEPVNPVARALSARRIPFLFLTGYGSQPVEAYPDAPVLGKPLEVNQLRRALEQISAPGRSTP